MIKINKYLILNQIITYKQVKIKINNCPNLVNKKKLYLLKNTHNRIKNNIIKMYNYNNK